MPRTDKRPVFIMSASGHPRRTSHAISEPTAGVQFMTKLGVLHLSAIRRNHVLDAGVRELRDLPKATPNVNSS